jgi:hypothetical protein
MRSYCNLATNVEARGRLYKTGEWADGWLDKENPNKTIAFPLFLLVLYKFLLLLIPANFLSIYRSCGRSRSCLLPPTSSV